MNIVDIRFLRTGLGVGLALLFLVVGLTGLLPAKASGTLPNGVAAGDVTQTSAVLWTRGPTLGQVLFEYSTDPAFSSAILTKTATVTTVFQPVKVEITGLSPATTYFYRATDAAGASAEGQFHTAVAFGTRTGLRFGVSGDWSGHLAPYPAITNAVSRKLDFFVELGDTFYADVPSPAVPLAQATSITDYRLKQHEVYSAHLGLNTWAALRASTSILASIDDHEVTNDFAGGAAVSSDVRFTETTGLINDARLYENGLQAFQEYNPIRDEFYGNTGDPRTSNERELYRFNTYGSDAAVFILDTRSFRDEPLPLEPTNPTSVTTFLTNSLNDASRTFLGAQQLADLKSDLLQAQANGLTWKFIFVSGPIQNLGVFAGPDRFEGYAAERTALLSFINDNGIENVVFVAASLHGTVVNNLTYQEAPLFGPQIPTSAFEVIAGPVAIDPPFGPAVIALAQYYGLITGTEKADYDSRTRAGKDEFVKDLINEKLLDPLGYDSVGLAGSGIDAELLVGDYVAVHTFGWTEFEIAQSAQILTVTTYGIDYYTPTLLATNPNDIITRTPTIVSQFIVTPTQAASLTAVAIGGRITGMISTTYTFSAVVDPFSVTTPITYSWQAIDHTSTTTKTHSLSNSINLTWSATGPKIITVTTNNGNSLVSNTHVITIVAGSVGDVRTYLPLILKN